MHWHGGVGEWGQESDSTAARQHSSTAAQNDARARITALPRDNQCHTQWDTQARDYQICPAVRLSGAQRSARAETRFADDTQNAI